MSVAAIVLICVGSALFLVWLFCFVNVVTDIRRRERTKGIASEFRTPPLTLFLDSLGLALNVVTLAAGLFWYKLRGKPLPPPPKVRR
jgi:hypothetical protein